MPSSSLGNWTSIVPACIVFRCRCECSRVRHDGRTDRSIVPTRLRSSASWRRRWTGIRACARRQWSASEWAARPLSGPRRSRSSRRGCDNRAEVEHTNRPRATAADAWVASSALSILPGARSVRLVCDSPANPLHVITLSPGDSRTVHTPWPIPQFASQDVVRYSEHAGSVAACSAIGPALDTPGAALRSCGPEHLEHAPLHAAASPGSEVSRGGLPQDRLVQFRVS